MNLFLNGSQDEPEEITESFGRLVYEVLREVFVGPRKSFEQAERDADLLLIRAEKRLAKRPLLKS